MSKIEHLYLLHVHANVHNVHWVFMFTAVSLTPTARRAAVRPVCAPVPTLVSTAAIAWKVLE